MLRTVRVITRYEQMQTVVELFAGLLECPTRVVACTRVVEASDEPGNGTTAGPRVMVRVNAHHH